MVHDPSNANETQKSGQVLKFRLRRRAPVQLSRARNSVPDDSAENLIDDLARYEAEDANIDYRHRMLMNVIAVVIVAFLVGIGVWLTDTISDVQKAQDCVLQGRQNCAPIEVPSSKH